ncbi:MAG: PPK2 family polyphosphate kinase [Bacteroidia bacterium]
MGNSIRLAGISTLPPEKITEASVEDETKKLLKQLTKIQNKLYAQKKFSVLIILQGMDTSGKDGAVKHVFSGVNPAGCNVKSFKKPTEEEALHHFLWRVSKECPARGVIQIFNRSHYEEILSPAVNKVFNKAEVRERCAEINAFEKALVKNNTILLKFYLHVSRSEQLKRLRARKKNKHKRWKYQKADIITIREHGQYVKAYENIFKFCSQPVNWKIVPSDEKWYKNYFILRSIVAELKKYPVHYPDIKL